MFQAYSMAQISKNRNRNRKASKSGQKQMKSLEMKKKRCEIESKKEMLFLVSKLNPIYKLLLSQQYKI